MDEDEPGNITFTSDQFNEYSDEDLRRAEERIKDYFNNEIPLRGFIIGALLGMSTWIGICWFLVMLIRK